MVACISHLILLQGGCLGGYTKELYFLASWGCDNNYNSKLASSQSALLQLFLITNWKLLQDPSAVSCPFNAPDPGFSF